MIIADLKITDRGSYYCCLPSNCSTQIDQDRCQKFALHVTIPGRDQYWTRPVNVDYSVFEQRPQNNGIILTNSDIVMPILVKPYFKQGKHFAKAVKRENYQNSTISLRKGYFPRPSIAGTAPCTQYPFHFWFWEFSTPLWLINIFVRNRGIR